MDILASIAGARSLWATGRRMGLNAPDCLKYSVSWYLSRASAFRAIAPECTVLSLSGGIRAAIRPNGVDVRTVADIFDRRLYEISGGGIRRVLDLGANIGLATLYLSSQFPEAEFGCVEPFPSNLDMLRKNIRLNNIRATVFEGVVGIGSGDADLDVGGAADNFSLTPAEDSARKLRVRQFSVPELLATLKWDEVDLLKIDIEGYEKTLFRHNCEWLSRVGRIVGEAHGHVAYRTDDVRADLAPLGFEVRELSFDAEYGLTIFLARRRSA